jgi:hypothetical protein
MLYTVTRNGQNYGPYTLEDLTRYVASGNISPSDMAKSDEMTDWVSVESLVNAGAATPPAPPAYQPGYAAPVYTAAGVVGDPPPNLNWGLVMLFTFLTCGIFAMVWSIVESAWMNRVVPASKQLILGIAVVVSDIVLSAFNEHHQMNIGGHNNWQMYTRHDHPAVGLLWFAWLGLLIYARFNMRNTMEQYYNTVEPIGLRLSGVMTFFFGGLYFQYHMNRINDMKRMAAYGMPRL